jgi:TetR/AcrR family transcriptional regulator, fatty acid metabolism regulator protein
LRSDDEDSMNGQSILPGGATIARQTKKTPVDKRERILDAAVKVFAQKGFFNSKVSEIARLADVADGTIYLYFKNKDDLLIRLFEDKMQWVIARFREGLSAHQDARSRLACLIGMHLAEFQANPDLAAVFQVELRQSSRFMREHEKVELKGYLDLIGAVIEQGQQEGVFRYDIPLGLIKRLIFGALDEVVSTWVLAGRHYPLEPLGEPLVDLFLRGIQRPPSATAKK